MTLAANDTSYSEIPGQLLDLFRGSELGYGTYRQEEKTPGKVKTEIKKTAKTVRGPTTAELWVKHLKGEQSLGIIPIREDGSCYWGVIDVDIYDLSHRDVGNKIKSLGLPLVLCRSKSGGFHLFAFVSDPIPASAMAAKLREFAGLLGYGTSEIFPKQASIDPDKDLGNWLNMPAYGGDSGNRNAYDAEGRGLSVKKFLDFAATKRLSGDAFLAFKAKAPAAVPNFADAPPCLQHLAAIGVSEGGRNNALFNFGVLAKKMKPEAWEPLLESWNQKHIRPPLTPDEVQIVFKSLRKKDYTYKCKDTPICNHCDRPTCLTRKFGVGDGSSAAQNKPVLICLADVKHRSINWLWRGKLALGKISTIAGQTSLGKSQLTIFMAATITNGGAWPFEEGRTEPGKVLMLTAEDDLADTVAPRFRTAGGNDKNMVILDAVRTPKGDRLFSLEQDIQQISDALDSSPDFKLVIIDPVSAYMGKIDQNSNTAVRSMLAPLQKLAEEHRVAILLVHHTVKGGGRAAIDAVNGSGAFVNASRALILVSRDTEDVKDDDGAVVKVEGKPLKRDTGWRNVTIAKVNNAGEDPDTSFQFRVIDKPLPDGTEASLVGDFRRASMTADEAIGFVQRGPGRPAVALDVAVKFLGAILKDGNVAVSVIKAKAKHHGITDATLENAKSQLCIESVKSGRNWVWVLPERQREMPF